MSGKADIQQAIIILQHELQKHTDLYDAFRASILSSLKENMELYCGVDWIMSQKCKDIDQLADRILERIIGEE